MNNISYFKPNLPIPGEGRWWSITLEEDAWELELLEPVTGTPYVDTHVVASARIFDSPRVIAEDFVREANHILNRLAKAEAFVGTYHKEENY